MGRRPLRLNTAGAVSLTEVRPKHWRARCRYRDAVGHVHWIERSGPSRTAARRALDEEVDARRGLRIEKLKPHHRFTVAVELWDRALAVRLRDGDIAATSADRYRYAMTAATRLLGELRLSELSPGALSMAFADLAAAGRSAASRRIIREVVDQVLDLCVQHGALLANPLQSLPRITDRRRKAPRALTAEQRRQLFAWLDGDETAAQRLARGRDLPDIIRLMIGTGTRIGEVVALRWSDVDLDGRPFGTALLPSITVAGTIVRVRDKGLTRHLGKTADSLRVVPIPRVVADLLLERRPDDPDPDEPVFPAVGRGGVGFTYREPRTVQRHIAAIRDELGWPWLTSHVFRKTCATLAHEAGVSDLSLGTHIGHTDRSSLLNVYLASPDLDPRLINALDAALRDS